MKQMPLQKRIDRKLIKIIEKIQNEKIDKRGKPISFPKASGILARRIA